MAAKKKTSKKKNSSKPKLGFLDHLFVLFEEIVSYFEVLFVYLKKQFNQGLRRSVISFLFILYFYFLLLAGSGFLLYSAYLTILLFTHENPALTSAILGTGLVSISLVCVWYFLKKISI